MSGRATPCRRGCCWTPHGVCAKSGGCGCHMSGRTRAEVEAAAAAGISVDEAYRRARLRQKSGEKIDRVRVKNSEGKWIAPKHKS